MRTIARSRILPFVLAALTPFAAQARAQIVSVRLSVTKNESKDQRATFHDTSGAYRREQMDSTVSYTVELRNFSSCTLSNLVVKWAVLYDPSTAQASGGGVSWNTAMLKVEEGEHPCSLGLGQ